VGNGRTQVNLLDQARGGGRGHDADHPATRPAEIAIPAGSVSTQAVRRHNQRVHAPNAQVPNGNHCRPTPSNHAPKHALAALVAKAHSELGAAGMALAEKNSAQLYDSVAGGGY
jgi:hypothetical protein